MYFKNQISNLIEKSETNKNINEPNGMKSPLQSENSKNSNLNGNIQSDNEMLSNEELP